MKVDEKMRLEIIRLWNKGDSASIIADKIVGLTRNQIVGITFRARKAGEVVREGEAHRTRPKGSHPWKGSLIKTPPVIEPPKPRLDPAPKPVRAAPRPKPEAPDQPAPPSPAPPTPVPGTQTPRPQAAAKPTKAERVKRAETDEAIRAQRGRHGVYVERYRAPGQLDVPRGSGGCCWPAWAMEAKDGPQCGLPIDDYRLCHYHRIIGTNA